MVHRFATYEEAMVFVAKKRSDGHGAEILNDNASTFWGPMPIGGVRVWVSEEAVEIGKEPPIIEPKPFSLPQEFSTTVMLLCLVTLGAVVGLLLLTAPSLIVAVVILLAIVAAWLFLMAALGVGLSEWIKAIRDRESKYHELALAGIGFVATIMFFVMLIYGTAY